VWLRREARSLARPDLPPVAAHDFARRAEREVACSPFNRKRGRAGELWQHQFWDRFLRHEKELAERLDYMHHNPVRRGLAKRPQDWCWSSYNNFSLEKQRVAACPVQIDYVRAPG
jgi:hypothetical protein